MVVFAYEYIYIFVSFFSLRIDVNVNGAMRMFSEDDVD